MNKYYKIRKIQNAWSLSLLAIVMICLGSCSGTEGPAGPVGPAGPQGPVGTAGPQGPAGSANVLYSNWTKAGTWIKTNQFGTDRFYFDITNVNRLTQAVLDQGVVLMYAKLETENNQVRQLPIRVYALFTEDIIDFTLTVNRIRVWSVPVRGPQTPIQPSPNHEFRYVIIPGGQAGRISYEKLTYAEAKDMFQIPD
ncbi:collagen-like protein [Persicitalea jodogahamensis]|uniref:Collagen-like protein n=1 Tax=Persicitalea jodogahamensis TaxID=402147 RepID=A0A8J3DDT6_9BACT|nr:collagen-like protein [Persicitalea jodogahamensis]GHB81092.1 hypothetical protein GCM10007390_39740 [Persicitalea jodogahamensis]